MKLMVVGQDQGRLLKIQKVLSPLKETGKLQISTALPHCLDMALDKNLSVLIFDTGQVNSLVFPFIEQVRQSGFSGPIVLTGYLSAKFDLCDIAEIRNLYFLQKPYGPEQLLGLVQNCVNDVEGVKQRKDQRFDVHEQATLEAYSSDFKTETVINNISRSGVRIEGNLGCLKKGDLLRLHFNFEKINKERLMSARVVWVKKESDNKEEAGLEFVSQKAVYQYLLDHAVA